MIMRIITDCPDRNIPPRTSTVIPAGTIVKSCLTGFNTIKPRTVSYAVRYNDEYLDVFNTDVDIEFEKSDYTRKCLCLDCMRCHDVVFEQIKERIDNISSIEDRTNVVYQIKCLRNTKKFVCPDCGAEREVFL